MVCISLVAVATWKFQVVGDLRLVFIWIMIRLTRFDESSDSSFSVKWKTSFSSKTFSHLTAYLTVDVHLSVLEGKSVTKISVLEQTLVPQITNNVSFEMS